MPGPPLAKRGAPHWPPYRPIGSPLGRRTLATGHTPPGASLAKRGGGPSPTGHLRHRLPHWPEKGPATHREKGTPTPHWPPTGHKGAAIGGRPSHLPHRPPTGQKGRGWDAFARPSPDWPPKGA